MSPCPSGKQFGDLTPPQISKCFSATPTLSMHSISKDDILDCHSLSGVSDLSPAKLVEDVGTPKFDDRKATAVFGSFQEMSQAGSEKNEIKPK